MIRGIGVDITEIQRIEKACQREAFFFRIFSEAERQLIGSNMSRAAGNFAAKEAFAKVLGTGFRGFSPIDVEVLRDDLGKPFYRLNGAAAEKAAAVGINALQLSISNTKQLAIAYAIGENTAMDRD
ncbi:MAG: holo-ACP synthase [Eubacteriales bacterium]|nr:holo-ACP synthase [Eubacteriales bacterium]